MPSRISTPLSMLAVVVQLLCMLLTVTSPVAAQGAAAAGPIGVPMPAGSASDSLGQSASSDSSIADVGSTTGATPNTTRTGEPKKGPKAAEYNTTTVAASACCAALQAIGFTSELPIIILDSPSANLTVQKNKEPGTMCTCGAPNASDYDNVAIEFGYRGSSSVVDYTKKSYNIKSLAAPQGKSADIHFLGMPKHSDWYAYGPENDHAMSRNWMAYGMWKQTGRWGSRTVWVEVFLVTDGKPLSMEHYHGLYMAGEKIERGKNRVDIPAYAPDVDITGGFIFRNEHGRNDGLPHFETRLSQQSILLDYPKRNVSQASLDWLTKYFDDYERQLLAPTSPAGYSKWVSTASLVDYFLITEMIKTPDGYRGSVYFSKAPGKPVEMGPVWDANESMGLCCGYPIEGYQSGGRSDGISGGSAISTNGWLFNICAERRRCKIDPLNGISQWYLALWKLPDFKAAVLTRWMELRASALSDEWLTSEIAKQAALIRNATDRNYAKWAFAYIADKVPLEQPTWTQEFATSTKFLSDWLVARARWLDAEIPKEAAAAGVVVPAQNATLGAAASNGSTGAAALASGAASDMPAGGSGGAGLAPLTGATQPRPLPAASGK